MDIEIIAVGGYDEVGRNMTAVRCGKEIVIFDTPKNFPQSGFQIGAFYLKRGYVGDIKFNSLEVQTPASIPGLKAIGYAA